MTQSYDEKVEQFKVFFSNCHNPDEKYKKIIELGREQPRLDICHKIPDNIVKGCQSRVYLRSNWNGESVCFEAESDALISAGLAAILVKIYSGETPEIILKYPPTYLEELGISSSLTPNRVNGLYSIHLKMKQEALKWLMMSSGTSIHK